MSVTGQATAAGTLLVLFAATDSPSGPNSLQAVAGGGLTWNLVGRHNAEPGDSEIWSAVEPAAQAAFTVTATEARPGSAAQTSLVELSSPTGTPAVAASAGRSGTSGLPNVTVTAAAWQAAVGNDYCAATATKATSGQTILDQYDPNSSGTAVDAFWLQTSPTATISDAAPTRQCWNVEAISVSAPASKAASAAPIIPPISIPPITIPSTTTTTTIPPTTTTTSTTVPATTTTTTVPPTTTTTIPPTTTTSTTIPPTTTTSTTIPATTTTTTIPPTTTTVPSGSAPAFATSVSANHTYLVDQYGKPFLVNGDSGWNAAWALDPADQATYLSDRQRDGFNTVLTDLIGSPPLGGNSNGANWNGDTPFTDSNFTPNPVYWSKIDTFFQTAQKYGISVFAIPIDAYATESVFSSMTNSQAQTFGQWLAKRYPTAQYPGIVWMLGNDYAGDGVGQGVSGFLSQYQSFMTGLGTARPITVELGYNESLSTDGQTLGPSMTLNDGYTYHPTYEAILRSRAAKNIPVVFIEGAYENAATGFPDSPLDLRKQLGWTMTSGGTGSFYGNDSLWQFGSGWQNQLDTSDVAQRQAFDSAFSGINWSALQPDVNNQLVTAGRNSEMTSWSDGTTPYTNDSTYGWYVSAAYTADGTLGVIYNPDASRNHITISSSVFGAHPTITAVDPTDGATTNLGWTTTPTMGANAGGDHDWLFIISASPKS